MSDRNCNKTAPASIPFVVITQGFDVKKPGIARVVVTPEQAAKWLAINDGNRRVRPGLVKYLSSQISSGEWMPDHPQPIAFSDAGRLIDGQHRLHAIIVAGVSVEARIEFGVPDKMREYLDTGISRGLEDRVCLIEDHRYNKVASQIVNYLFTSMTSSTTRPSPEQAREIFESHRDSITWISQHKKNDQGIGRVSVVVAAMEYYERDREKAADFYSSLVIPDGPVQQSRILRDYLLQANRITGGSTGRVQVYGRCVGAMKAHLEDREIKIIRVANWNR